MAFTANAFKVETHAWIGQQVINDLRNDHAITFNLNGQVVSLPIEEDVATSILNNQEAYILGHIGPDAAPDIIVGQSLIHPGRGGWTTAHWMGYLLDAYKQNESENVDLLQSFSYGFWG